MKPYEHYLEAEKLVERADEDWEVHRSCERQMMFLAEAQVHATLALVYRDQKEEAPTHSCSCHGVGAVPCVVCENLGCDIPGRWSHFCESLDRRMSLLEGRACLNCGESEMPEPVLTEERLHEIFPEEAVKTSTGRVVLRKDIEKVLGLHLTDYQWSILRNIIERQGE